MARSLRLIIKNWLLNLVSCFERCDIFLICTFNACFIYLILRRGFVVKLVAKFVEKELEN